MFFKNSIPKVVLFKVLILLVFDFYILIQNFILLKFQSPSLGRTKRVTDYILTTKTIDVGIYEFHSMKDFNLDVFKPSCCYKK
jgi:hypothetical protein